MKRHSRIRKDPSNLSLLCIFLGVNWCFGKPSESVLKPIFQQWPLLTLPLTLLSPALHPATVHKYWPSRSVFSSRWIVLSLLKIWKQSVEFLCILLLPCVLYENPLGLGIDLRKYIHFYLLAEIFWSLNHLSIVKIHSPPPLLILLWVFSVSLLCD